MNETIYYTCLDYDIERRNVFLTPLERLIYLQLLEYFRFDDGKGINGTIKTRVDFA